MIKSLIMSFCIFLTIYCLSIAVIEIFGLISSFLHGTKKEKYIITLTVKNQEKTLEGIVRNIVFSLSSEHWSDSISDIVIIDLGSTDDTVKIAEKLSCDYPFVYYVKTELATNSINRIETE